VELLAFIFDANAPLWLILGTVEQWNAENQQSRLRISNQVAKTGREGSYGADSFSIDLRTVQKAQDFHMVLFHALHKR
jgi:hypothetical protein